MMNKKKWKKIKKRFSHRLEFAMAITAMWTLQHMSLKRSLKAADRLGAFIFHVLRIRRNIVLANLASAFSDMDESERLATAKRTYQNFTKMIFEYMRFPVLDKETVLDLVDFVGLEKLDRVMGIGKGASMVAGHFGNWELMGAALAFKGYPIAFLVGEQKNKRVDRYMNSFREMMGIKIIHMGVAVRGVIKALRNNEMVALLSDQDARRDGIFVDFLGRPSSTYQGAAIFSLKTGAPLIFGSIYRLPEGRHRIEIELFELDHLDGITDENVHEVTQLYTSRLEAAIRRAPDHWFWFHKRWKTHPKVSK
ncbi:lysophospholipid acyltransferase family protein [bacterium]|nr:lysophospholipid acyltransferase family protein [bacterium]